MSNNVLAVVFLTLLWLVLQESTSANNIVLGAVVSSFIVFSLSARQSDQPRFRVLAFLRLIWYVGLEFVIGSVKVSWDVITPKSHAKPFVMRYDLRLKNPQAQVAYACSVTFTPGSLAVDLMYDDDGTAYALVHIMYEDSEESARASLTAFEDMFLACKTLPSHVVSEQGGAA